MEKVLISRILVALDASSSSRNILQAGIKLATHLNAELNVLFIEDIDLLHVAELPFVREVIYGAPVGRSINVMAMERSMQTQSAQLRKLVESIARENQIKITFSVMRGNVARMLCDASQQTDLLVIGKNTQLLLKSRKIGSITRLVLATARCNLVVLQYGSIIERPVVVVYTGDRTSQRALTLAIELAREDHNQLIIVLPAVDDSDYQQLCESVQNNVRDHSLQISLVRLPINSAEQILQVIQQVHGRILLLESDSAFLTDLEQQLLIMQSDVPVILLR
ncbi:universal stress protein [Nitrosomonas marina]|uniref:Nucleotide-binding universal stress protein, UspA family n=1 Tax=Nitrosomonas marina TaxID=917 RepID=A0A1H8HJ24_9PROT|nr:universal stress protein [Nitrosomonas marina]SEN56069.1 Nucleotide-binding universal stress protein, UspA family [Nitrosomonas marina]